MRDKIAQIIAEELLSGGTIDSGCDKIIAALPDIVKAKPLAWGGADRGGWSHSGQYRTGPCNTKDNEYGWCFGGEHYRWHPSAGEAKAAAEAHHQAAFRAMWQGVE